MAPLHWLVVGGWVGGWVGLVHGVWPCVRAGHRFAPSFAHESKKQPKPTSCTRHNTHTTRTMHGPHRPHTTTTGRRRRSPWRWTKQTESPTRTHPIRAPKSFHHPSAMLLLQL